MGLVDNVTQEIYLGLVHTNPNTSKTEYLLKESTSPQHETSKSWPIRVISCRRGGKDLRGLTIAL